MPSDIFPNDVPALWAIADGSAVFARIKDQAQYNRASALTPQAQADFEKERVRLPMVVSEGVAVIDVLGPMEKRPSWMGWTFGFASTQKTRQALANAINDPDVSSIVLRLDSPGGTVDGLAEVGDDLWAARQAGTKPIIAQVDGMLASAAYYVASQANQIVAGRMDLVGSIGTKLVLLDLSKMAEKEGVEVVLITTGEMKAAGEPGTEITDEQKEYFQGIVDGYFEDFIKVVGRGRGLTPREVRDRADGGRVFLAPEAKARGLIDRIGTFEDTVGRLQTQASRSKRNQRARAELAFAE